MIKRTITEYQCDNCPKTTQEFKGDWQHSVVMHPSYDEIIIACSDECAEKLDMKISARKAN